MGFRAAVPAAVLAVCGMCLLAATAPVAAASSSDTRAGTVGISDQLRAAPPNQLATRDASDLLGALSERQRVTPASPADGQKDAAKFDADLAGLRQAVQKNDKAATAQALKDIVADANALLADLG